MKSAINSDYIGALIDGWESLPNDLRADLTEAAPSFVKAIADIYAETHGDCDAGYDCNDDVSDYPPFWNG